MDVRKNLDKILLTSRVVRRLKVQGAVMPVSPGMGGTVRACAYVGPTGRKVPTISSLGCGRASNPRWAVSRALDALARSLRRRKGFFTGLAGTSRRRRKR